MADTNVAPGLEGVAATHSSISHIDGAAGLLSYRGYAIDDLVTHSSFEEVALLLLDGELPNASDLEAFDQGLRSHRQVKYNVREIMKFMPVTGHPMDMLHCAVASLGMFYPQQELSDAERENTPHLDAMAMRIIARMPTIVAMWEQMRFGNDPIVPRTDLNHAANFLYMLSGREPNPELAKILDSCLILHAEHTINASTFSVLVTGSTLTNPYHVIGGAIGTLAGPLHGGANQKVVEMLEEIGSVARVATYLDAKMAHKEKIWGFGHRVYKTRDPRAAILKEMMEKLASNGQLRHSQLFEIAMEVEKLATERLGPKGIHANVDFYSGVLYHEMGIKADLFTPIFAMARSAGWLAHWREQLADNRIFRPTQVYNGASPRQYVAIDKRNQVQT
ncbi:citrate synthase [Acidithiobacillus sp. M4-SHS-6]|uniref:citrate synthase n=1 Tax=Acidithiobacillus sp. M4-SHS-6 TaxID=3383024 RepID=UPI0039BE3A9E